MTAESTRDDAPRTRPWARWWPVFVLTALVSLLYVAFQKIVSPALGPTEPGVLTRVEFLRLWVPLVALCVAGIWLVAVKFPRGIARALVKYHQQFSELLAMFLFTECALLVATSLSSSRWWGALLTALALASTGALWTMLVVNWYRFYKAHADSIDEIFKEGAASQVGDVGHTCSAEGPRRRAPLVIGIVAAAISLTVAMFPVWARGRPLGFRVFDIAAALVMVLGPTVMLLRACWTRLAVAHGEGDSGTSDATSIMTKPNGVVGKGPLPGSPSGADVRKNGIVATVAKSLRWLVNRPLQLDEASYALLAVAGLAIASTALLFGSIESFHATHLAASLHIGSPFVPVPDADVASRLSAWFAFGVQQFFLSNEVFFDFFQSVGADSRLIEAAGGRSLEVTSGSAVSLIVFGGHLVFGITIVAVVTDQIGLNRRVRLLFSELGPREQAHVLAIDSILGSATNPRLRAHTLKMLHARGLLEGEVRRILRRGGKAEAIVLWWDEWKARIKRRLFLEAFGDTAKEDCANARVAAHYCWARWYADQDESPDLEGKNSLGTTNSTQVDGTLGVLPSTNSLEMQSTRNRSLELAASYGAWLRGNTERVKELPSPLRTGREQAEKRLEAELWNTYKAVATNESDPEGKQRWADLAWAASGTSPGTASSCALTAGGGLTTNAIRELEAACRGARSKEGFAAAQLVAARLLRATLHADTSNPYDIVVAFVEIRGWLLGDELLFEEEIRPRRAGLNRLVDRAIRDPDLEAIKSLFAKVFDSPFEEKSGQTTDLPEAAEAADAKLERLKKIIFLPFEENLADRSLLRILPENARLPHGATHGESAFAAAHRREAQHAAAEANVTRLARLELAFSRCGATTTSGTLAGGSIPQVTDARLIELVTEALGHVDDPSGIAPSKAAVSGSIVKHLHVVLAAIAGATRDGRGESTPDVAEQRRAAMLLIEHLPTCLASPKQADPALKHLKKALEMALSDATRAALRRLALLIGVKPRDAATEEPVSPTCRDDAPIGVLDKDNPDQWGAVTDQSRWRWMSADDPPGGFCVLDFPVTRALWSVWELDGSESCVGLAGCVTEAQARSGTTPSVATAESSPKLNESFRAVTAFIERVCVAQAAILGPDWKLRLPTFDEWRLYSVLQTDSRTYSMPVRRTECAVNRFGIFAPRGHVLEWVLSDSGDAPTPLVVGASWVMAAERSRTDAKTSADPGFHRADIGFRLVLTRRRPAD